MGTDVRVTLWHADGMAGAAALEAVFAETARIEALTSTSRDDSPISEINREAASRPVAAGGELYELIVRSLDISVLTHGAFDITYDSVGQYYDIPRSVRPDDATVAAELPNINFHHVETDPAGQTIRFLRDGTRINLGGIARGYAVERAIAVLRERGIRHAIVTAGGDTRLLGDRRGNPWVVGIRDPRADDKLAMRIPLVDVAISTSGDYERFFIEDGVRYHDILTPATGKPAGEIMSATVVGPDAVLADALSTSIFVMGVDSGLRLIGTLPDYEGVVIDAAGWMHYSDGLQPSGPALP